MALRPLFLTTAFSLGFALACGSDDDETPAGTGGSAGKGGSSGSASGSSGAGGSSGTGGSGGASATGGAGGTSGAAGSGAGTGGTAGSGGTGATDGGTVTDGGSSKMSFFVTSKGVGDATGKLGGLNGADQHCLTLAQAAGSTKTHWVAYLSVQNGPAAAAVNAKDRIGTGPWYNAKGETFAANVAALHPAIDPVANRAAYIAAKPADAL